MRRLAIWIFTIIVVLIVWPIFRTHQLERNFKKLKPGDTRQAVLGQMGNPWKQTQCGYISGGAPDCAEEFIYANPYAPYLPEYWVLQFNRNQQLTNAFYATSL